MKYIIITLAIFTCGCSNKNDEAKNIYDKKAEIIKDFSSKSVIRSRGQNIILFYTHSGSKTNKYFFEIKDNQFYFLNDSIEYSPDLLMLKYERGSEPYKNELLNYVKSLLATMDALKIRDFTSEWLSVGVNIKIYMQSQAVILFIEHPSNIKAPRFKDYVNSMIRLDSNWYFSKEDK
jgi:hypothetical protein